MGFSRAIAQMCLLGCLVLDLGGCGAELSPASEVKDLRILAVRADPPELLYDGPNTLAEQSVRFEALVIDPAGAAVDYAWSFCPVESNDVCEDFAQQLQDLDPMQQEALQAARSQQQEATAQAPTDVFAPYDVESFEPRVSAEVVHFHIQQSQLGVGVGAWPSAVLRVSAGQHSVRAQKRLVLNYRDLTNVASFLADDLGLVICTGSVTTDCLRFDERTSNANPVFTDVLIAQGGRADATFEPAASVVPLGKGETIRILPQFSDASFESYQAMRIALEGNQIHVDDLVEILSVSWFATGGELVNDVTYPQLTLTFDNEFTAPETVPTSGEVSVYMVVRDQRGGVAWQRLRIEITP